MTPQQATPCERCGSFNAAMVALAGRELCPDCVKRAASTERYWTSRYLTGLGAALNPAAASVLLTLNYRRLGDAKQARTWGILSAVLLAFYLAVMLLDLPIPGGALIGAGVAAGISIGRAWEPTWKELHANGAARANPWLPPILTILAVVGVVVVLVVLDSAKND